MTDVYSQFITDAGKAHDIVHGTSTQTVTTDGGPVRTFAKLIADNQATFDNLSANYAPKNAPQLTGTVQISTNGALGLSNTTASGAVISMTGNGSVTPSKFFRVISGVLQILNNAFTAAIATLTDTGALTIPDVFTSTGLVNNGTTNFKGQLGLNYVSPVAVLNDLSGTGQASVTWQNGGQNIWSWFKNTDNTFNLARYVGGSFVDTPIAVDITTGLVSFIDGIALGPTKGIKGKTDGSAIPAGYVGEIMEFVSAVVTLPANVPNNMGGGLSLSPGVWDITGSVNAGSTTGTWNLSGAGISNTGGFGGFGTYVAMNTNMPVNTNLTMAVPTIRRNISVSESAYLIVQLGNAGTAQVKLRATRVA